MFQTHQKSKIKIAIADDQILVRESFANALSSHGFLICGQASDGSALLDIMFECKPDAVLLDLEMPVKDGWSTLPLIKKHYPDTKVIILTQHAFNDALIELFDKGANAVIGKNLSLEILIKSIQEVLEKGFSFGPDFTSYLQNKKSAYNLIKNHTSELSDIERKVLLLICKDLLTKDIALELNVTTRTAERYVAALYEKTKTRSPAGLLTFAVKNKLHQL